MNYFSLKNKIVYFKGCLVQVNYKSYRWFIGLLLTYLSVLTVLGF